MKHNTIQPFVIWMASSQNHAKTVHSLERTRTTGPLLDRFLQISANWDDAAHLRNQTYLGITRETDRPACTMCMFRSNIRWNGKILQNVIGEIIGSEIEEEKKKRTNRKAQQTVACILLLTIEHT